MLDQLRARLVRSSGDELRLPMPRLSVPPGRLGAARAGRLSPVAPDLEARRQPESDPGRRHRPGVLEMAIPHPRDIQVAVVDWLDERYPFTKAVDEALYQRVPNFANAFYYCFGGMVFILIVLQLLTGILLALYYVPDATGNPAPAYTSVNFIQNDVYLGWLIRGVHFWGANLLIIMVLLHMARVYWTGSYRAPRELNWMVGVLMLLI